MRLSLGFLAAAIMIGTSIWSYFIEKEWKNNKKACAIAVVMYVLLSSLCCSQTLNCVCITAMLLCLLYS